MKTSTSSSARPLRDEVSSMWAWVKQHRLLVGSAAVVVLGLALGWNWLATAGVLPFLFFLPCALMMGMCMKGMGSNKSGSSHDKQDEPSAGSNSTTPAASLSAGSSHVSRKKTMRKIMKTFATAGLVAVSVVATPTLFAATQSNNATNSAQQSQTMQGKGQTGSGMGMMNNGNMMPMMKMMTGMNRMMDNCNKMMESPMKNQQENRNG